MRHGKKVKKLSRTKSHRETMLSNLVISLFLHRMIKTTTAKAKALRPVAERLITFAKKGDLAAKRQVYRVLKDHKLVKKLFEEIAPQFASRNGGYTRVLRLGTRLGDGADLSLVELLVAKPAVEKVKGKKAKKEKVKEVEAKKEKVEKTEVTGIVMPEKLESKEKATEISPEKKEQEKEE